MADADITRRALSLGSQDNTTGWYSKSFTETTIKGSVQSRGAVVMISNGFSDIARHPHSLFTSHVVNVGDEIIDGASNYYLVKAVTPHYWLDDFSHFQCELEKRTPHALRPTTSGTWHLDSDSLKTDPRYRHKLWLDTYLTANNMELDDGTTDADVITYFSKADYPIEKVFLTKGVDGVMAIDKQKAQQLTTYNHYPYAFIETVPITCYAVDKSGLTATNLLEQMEKEIQHVCSDHPIGSIRSIDATAYKSTNIGGTTLWETTVTIRYKRYNDDYVPSYPCITWGASGSPDGTYIFPNCIRMRWPNSMPDIKLLPPGRVGSVHQIMGDNALTVELTCDLDVGNATYTWERPQTTTPKTDRLPWEVFMEMKHQAGIIAGDEPYQTFTADSNGPSFKVRLQRYDVIEDGSMNQLVLTLEEYVSVDQSGNTYDTRYAIT